MPKFDRDLAYLDEERQARRDALISGLGGGDDDGVGTSPSSGGPLNPSATPNQTVTPGSTPGSGPPPSARPTVTPGATLPSGGMGPIPTNPNGSQVGSGITWAEGSDRPLYTPPGFVWDPVHASFREKPKTPDVDPEKPKGNAGQRLQQLLNGGMSPQEAVAMINREFGLGHGTEAVYYNDHRGHTIGLPDVYLARTPDGSWEIVQRVPGEHTGGGGGGGGQDPQQFAILQGMMKSLNDYLRRQEEQNAEILQARRDSLLRLMGDAQKPVDVENDPQIRPALDAYRTARRRGQAEDRARAAERAAFEGLNLGGQGSGSFNSAIESMGERASQDIASFNANHAINELRDRRSMLLQALQLADAIGARSEQQQLQGSLAQIDAMMRQQQLTMQGGQFEDTMSFQYADMLRQMRRDAYIYGYGGE